MIRTMCVLALCSGVLMAAARAGAVQPGTASGTFTYDSTKVALSRAVETRVENLFDDKKQDTLVVLTDKPLGDIAADDDIGLSLRARTGEITALVLRVDGGKLVNVSAYHRGLAGKVLLPGAWFQYAGAARGAGSLKLAARAFDGHSYACAVEFAAAPAVAPAPAAPVAAPQPAPRAEEPPPAPATTSSIDPKATTALLVQAIMLKDEHQALEIIKLGADPNGRDQYGTPVLNWAVMMCQPKVVKALVDKKADLKYQRAPGMTIMVEAGACPEAAAILRAAGAR
jgi:hypothetical protein